VGVSNDQLYAEIVNISRTLGTLSANVGNFKDDLAAHMIEDASMKADIEKIQLRLAKQSGSVRVWGIVATTIAGAVSTAVSLFIHKSG
jgi:regulator of replication initiation timing